MLGGNPLVVMSGAGRLLTADCNALNSRFMALVGVADSKAPDSLGDPMFKRPITVGSTEYHLHTHPSPLTLRLCSLLGAERFVPLILNLMHRALPHVDESHFAPQEGHGEGIVASFPKARFDGEGG